jgi:hypothetical protein
MSSPLLSVVLFTSYGFFSPFSLLTSHAPTECTSYITVHPVFQINSRYRQGGIDKKLYEGMDCHSHVEIYVSVLVMVKAENPKIN